jgi:beta-glucanase (GH16 family)
VEELIMKRSCIRGKIQKVVAVALALTLAVPGIAMYEKKSATEVNAADNWKLVWSDGTSLDTSVWSYEIGNGSWGWGNGEVEYYTDRKDNVNVSDGTLQIIAKKESYGGQQYTSGRIITKGKKAFLYGKMEARIKVENGNQSGVWPAFWMMGNNMNNGVSWPNCGEIDIMEHANDRNYVGGCLHWNYEGINGSWDKHGSYGSGDANQDFYFADNVNNGINGWHTYGLIWDESHMEWQVDGITYFQQSITDNNAYCFQKEQFFLLNLAIGGTGSAYTGYQTAPSDYKTTTMYVDYVRVYQKDGSTSAETTTKNPSTTNTPVTTVSAQETETTVDYQTVDAAASCKNVFGSYYGGAWAGDAAGTSTATSNTGITMNATAVGNNMWGIQAYLRDLEYVAGNTYTYKFTINSDVDKSVHVKVVGDDDEHIIYEEDISVKANVPYEYEKQITIPSDYTAPLNLYFGLGGNPDRENISQSSAMNLSISNVSFVTRKKVVTVIPVTTAKQNNNQQTTKPNSDNTEKTTKTSLAKGKVKKSKRSRNNRKVKLTFKKIKYAHGYQVRWGTSKKLKSARSKKTNYRTCVIKKLKRNRKYYVQVRAYRYNDDGTTTFGKWSRRRAIKIRKK